MAVPIVITKALTAANATIVAGSQTPTSGTALTLVGGGVVTLDTMRRVLLTPGSEASPRTLVLTGTDNQGSTISETLAVPNGSTTPIQSLRDYKTITSAMPLGGGWSAAMTLGTSGVGSTEPQIVNWHVTSFEIGLEVELLSGSGNVSLEITRDPPYAPLSIYTAGMGIMAPICNWQPWPQLSNLAETTIGTIDDPITAFRLTINSGTGTWQVSAVPVGFRT